MMTEEQFIESQKECADMLGMSLSEYQEYCKNLKVPDDTKEIVKKNDGNTNKFLKFIGVSKTKLKTRKE